MQFIFTKISGVALLKPKVFGDDRGYFMESFRDDLFSKEIPGVEFIQENESSSGRGVLRGLHYQLPPFAQSKLVRVVCGKVLDVALDIRKNSLTFGMHVSVELSGDNKHQLFIPRGFAYAFLVLSEKAIFQYKVDNLYSPDYERGIAFDDPHLAIEWGMNRKEIILSQKDSANPLLKDAEIFV